MVSVHTGYAVGDSHVVLDSDLFVPESWANDPAKRKEVGIPDEVTHRSKSQIALAQIERALSNGIRVAAWTFDEHYGQSYDFLDALDRLGQTYVAEVPCTFCGWAKEPAVLHRPTSRQMRMGGGRRKFPRLAKTAAPVSEVRNLLNHSPAFRDQSWTPMHIKNGEKGPIVREVKAVRFFMRRNCLPTREHWLIVTRDPQSGELKFFVSNASPGVPLEWLVYVAYSRWPIEQFSGREVGKRRTSWASITLRFAAGSRPTATCTFRRSAICFSTECGRSSLPRSRHSERCQRFPVTNRAPRPGPFDDTPCSFAFSSAVELRRREAGLTGGHWATYRTEGRCVRKRHSNRACSFPIGGGLRRRSDPAARLPSPNARPPMKQYNAKCE